MLRVPMLIAVTLLASLPLATAAGAAVRSCKAPVAGNLSSAPTETLARKAALENWVAKARQHGAGYASWRLAAQKALKCVKGPTGGFDCIAYGAPCIIQQAPGRPKRPGPGGTMSI